MRTLLLAGLALAAAEANPLADWDRYEKQVRDQVLAKDSLRAMFPGILAAVQGGPSTNVGGDSDWTFPVHGYSLASVGKGGFKPGIYYGGSDIKGYDFFDGNRHGGHPAYDIFIRDKNRDSRDDRTGKPVPVVAPIRLVVLSTDDSWKPGSAMRGGNYVWALAPGSGMLLYFAHLDSISARPGDTLTTGQTLGTVGRTGKNAYAARSPTHLHFMALWLENGIPVPFDYFPRLNKRLPGRE